jgi:DNA mismatch endonuclease (patch repair protein)
MDRISPARRSENMARITSKNTGIELIIRSITHRLGYRFRLHRRDLPGTPDLVFPGRRKIIIVHGCFWHRHRNCKFAYMPKSNQAFWQRKFDANIRHDKAVMKELRKLKWSVLVIWGCGQNNPDALSERIDRFLSARQKTPNPGL